MNVRARIIEKLQVAFTPDHLEVLDQSEDHRGHGGWRPGGETHFRVEIVAAQFSGLGRLARHRLVHDALARELAGRVHALSIKAQAPDDNAPA
ncbi:MAG: BolA family protein [Alphaproteobacteria bacterium]